MIKLVVLEDTELFQEKILKVIDNELLKIEEKYVVENYNTYNENLSNTILNCSNRTIYILDIEIANSKSGLDVAKEIRKHDWDSEIIFVTSHDKMFETVYRSVFKIFDFIEKYIDLEERLAKDLNLILSQKADHKKFIYENNKVKVQLYQKDILYIFRDTTERKLVIQTANNQFLVTMTIPEMLSALDNRFKQIHRACIVNSGRVNKYNWNEGTFILDSGEEVALCSKAFKENINV